MKKLFCILLVLMLVTCAVAAGEGTQIDRRDGQVHYLSSGDAFDGESVTPFTARPYRFADSEQIARIFYGPSEYSLDYQNDEVNSYVSQVGTLIVSIPERDAGLHFDSAYANTVFTPIPLALDTYVMQSELECENEELSFMSRAEAEEEAERFVNEIYKGLSFQVIANFAITKSDYDTHFTERREELEEAITSGDKTTQDMKEWVDFPQEDLGYLICLAQVVNELPISWSFFQNVSAMERNLPVELWLFWTPYGCRYFSGGTVIQPQENTDPREIIMMAQVMDVFSDAYNYILGAKEIEVYDIRLVWFADAPNAYTAYGDIADPELQFRPMWCLYTPYFYGYEFGGYEVGYYVDACTGETWV